MITQHLASLFTLLLAFVLVALHGHAYPPSFSQFSSPPVIASLVSPSKFGSAQLGTHVSSPGDINGDGFDDFTVSGPYATPPGGLTSAGIVFLYWGRVTFSWPQLTSFPNISIGLLLCGSAVNQHLGVCCFSLSLSLSFFFHELISLFVSPLFENRSQ